MANVDSNDGSSPRDPVTTNGSSYANELLIRSSSDPWWKYGTLCDLKNKDAIKCNLSGFISRAGVTRLKYHMSGIKGKGISICKNASKEDKAMCAD